LKKRVRGIGVKSVEKMVDNGLTINAQAHFVNPMVGPRKKVLALVDVVLAVKTALVLMRIVRDQVAVTRPIRA